MGEAGKLLEVGFFGIGGKVDWVLIVLEGYLNLGDNFGRGKDGGGGEGEEEGRRAVE